MNPLRQKLSYLFHETPLGLVLAAFRGREVSFLQFGSDPDSLLNSLRTLTTEAPRLEDDQIQCQRIHQWIESFFNQNTSTQDVIVSPIGSPFERLVWNSLCDIPSGETRSYQDVARSIGVPKATRAVARACSRNPVAVAIPCHRVIRKDGGLSGYRWGIERKHWLLDHERNRGTPPILRPTDP